MKYILDLNTATRGVLLAALILCQVGYAVYIIINNLVRG